MSKFNRGSVFLSYADKDIKQAQNIYDGLTKRGLNVWFDIADFKHRSWENWAIEAINQSRCLIVCISQASLRELSNDIPGSPDRNIRTAYKIAQRERREDLFLFVNIRNKNVNPNTYNYMTKKQMLNSLRYKSTK